MHTCTRHLTLVQSGVRLNAGVGGVETADKIVADVLKLGVGRLLLVRVAGEQLERVLALLRKPQADDQLTVVLTQQRVVAEQPRVQLVVKNTLENRLDARRVKREANVDEAVGRLDHRFTV